MLLLPVDQVMLGSSWDTSVSLEQCRRTVSYSFFSQLFHWADSRVMNSGHMVPQKLYVVLMLELLMFKT